MLRSVGRRAAAAAAIVATALAFVALPSPASSAVGDECPCTLFPPTATPVLATATDSQPVEVGVRFGSQVDGFVTAIRFYKGPTNTGVHRGHLWSADGQQLAEVTFTDETSAGWQQASFPEPVPVSAGLTYVASYHASVGNYAVDQDYFTAPVESGPLFAPASTAAAPNGVFRYGTGSQFPNESYRASNYWVDPVFVVTPGPDTVPPRIVAQTPADGATGVDVGAPVTARLSEAANPATVTTTTVQLRGPDGTIVPSSVSYDAASRTILLDPTGALAPTVTYRATVRGGTGGVRDVSGNALATDVSWSFTTAAVLDDGPGGRVLVVKPDRGPVNSYYAEILRAEGLNAFSTTTVSRLTATALAPYDAVVLGKAKLTSATVATLTAWVNGGGNLVAMRPDRQLAPLLGLTPTSTTLREGYLKVDTSTEPGRGIVADSMQFHGVADRYRTNGARTVATLYSSATTATRHPAVTIRDVGTSGGQAVAFTYDLAQSVVLTRQGNPAWAGQSRDGQAGPIRSDNLFYPGYVDFAKIQIPQADEQQRLLANVLTTTTRDRLPLPRFGYFPDGEKAVVVMTGDDHGNGGTTTRFEEFLAASPAGCSVERWECVRGTSYIYPDTPLSDGQADAYEQAGFELALHLSTGCANYTPASLEAALTDQLSSFAEQFPSLRTPQTNRTHCIAWSDWVGTPEAEARHGIRLDTNYYYWPAEWVGDRPGLFTGSGMPMRFSDTDGTLIDVYQATTQMTDESGQSYPRTVDALLDNAVGPKGFYGAFVANMHTDDASNSADTAAIVASAQARGVPVITARQLLTWVDARNASTFRNLSYGGSSLRFDVVAAAGSTGLQAMVPTAGAAGTLSQLTAGGVPVAFQRTTVKGVEYAVFTATNASYVATYSS